MDGVAVSGNEDHVAEDVAGDREFTEAVSNSDSLVTAV